MSFLKRFLVLPIENMNSIIIRLHCQEDLKKEMMKTITQPSNKLLEIEANKEGLISLAKILFSIAYTKELPPEIHLWGETGKGKSYSYGDLDEGSLDLSIVRIKKEGRKNKISSF